MNLKLEIRDDSKNYACTVVKLPVKQKVEGLDNLVKVTIFGNDVLTQKNASEEELYLFFPAECVIDPTYLGTNNEYRHTIYNQDKTAKPGFFEDSGRVKSIKFKGVISTGYIAPVSTLDEGYPINWTDLKEGDEFTDIDGFNVCKKYKVMRDHTSTSKESRFNKKLQRFDKLVHNQFRFHTDTSQLAKNLHVFHPDDVIVITDKWHGTSAIFANIQVKAELSWRENIARFLWKLITGDKLGEGVKYDNLYASRSVIKNQFINKDATPGFYGEDVWKIVNDEVKAKIEPGITLYGEIVGYTPSGKHIQKGYDYGCDQLVAQHDMDSGTRFKIGEHCKFLVYRITYTKPDGNVIEFSWQQIKNYCQKYQLEHVKELYFGKPIMIKDSTKTTVEQWREDLFSILEQTYLEKDCTYCVNKVPAEGIVVRRDGQESYSAYKLKAKRFFERESKQLDEDAKKGEINIEDATDNNN